MCTARRLVSLGVLTLAFLAAWPTGPIAGHLAADLPAKLDDQEFWRLSEEFSEPGGVFQSDNLTSNELVFARIVPALVASTTPGGVYLGVGPEQNFTYIAAMKPAVAFITDIRRGNLHLHLMYKALFELSADRAEFVARLFTKTRPASLTGSSSVADIMNAYWDLTTLGEPAYAANLKAIVDQLTKTHHLPLTAADLDGIGRVYRTFYWYGPAINYGASSSLNMANAGRGISYWDLMTQNGPNEPPLSYLATEERFAVVKDLESRNLLVPVVGNFAGPKALRAVGTYLKAHGATVGAFYLSNVETYLKRDQIWPAFCANVASMPLDDASAFIRPSGVVAISSMNASVSAAGSTAVDLIFTLRSVAASTGTRGPSGIVPIAPEVKACAGGLK